MKKNAIAFLVAALTSSSIAETAVVNGVMWTYIIAWNGEAWIGGNGGAPAVSTDTTGEITIPSMFDDHPVTKIRSQAFSNCSGLESVTIPNCVKIIDNSAFSGCTELSSITIPDSVTSIGSGAFSGCSKLTTISISDNVTRIYSDTFSDCPSVIFNTSRTTLWHVPSTLRSYDIPAQVTRIGDNAFNGCSKLSSITIPAGVTSIGNNAFSGCQELTAIDIPSSVTNVGQRAFYGCSGLASVTLSDGMTSIGDNAFERCSGLTSVTIPDGVTSIGLRAFYGCFRLATVVIPDNVTSIGDYAFCDCTGLASINIGNSVTTIGNSAFSGSSVTAIVIPDGVVSVGSSAFSGCQELSTITIPDSVKSIGQNAFQSCSKLTVPVYNQSGTTLWHVPTSFSGVFTIPEEVTSIGDYSFENCSGLTSVAIPDGVTNIGRGAFYNCSKLSYISIPDGVTSIDDDTFWNCSRLSSITIPNDVTRIGDHAFANCRNLSSIRIPDSLTSLGYDAFPSSLYDTNSIPGIVLVGRWVVGHDNSLSGELDLAGIRGIAPFALEDCYELTTVTIPPGLASIGREAFWGCSGLTEVRISDLAAWCNISFGADANPCYYAHHLFLNGKEITDLVIPDGVTRIGDYAFSGCSLSSLSIPGEVRSIGDFAFAGCSMTSVVLGKGLRQIGDSAFGSCSGLTSIELPEGLLQIEGFAFIECNQLTSCVIPSSVTQLGRCLFIFDNSSLPHNPKELWFPRRFENQMDNQYIQDDWTVHFYDYLLSVVSEHGTPAPFAMGTHYIERRTVTNSVEEIVYDATNGIRYVCTGWTGTGSAPVSGTGTNVTFAIEENSTITWNWRTQVLVSVTATGGECEFGSRWLDFGEVATAEIVSPFSLCNIRLSGDVEGVTVDGRTLRIPADRPREIAVAVSEAWPVSLSVESMWGLPTPTNGVHTLLSGNEFSVSVSEPEPAGGVRYVCTGWTGTGSVPASGTATNATFEIEEDSTITWNWKTQCLVSVSVAGGECEFGSRWVDLGSGATAEIFPDRRLYAIALSGDTNGVSLAGTTLAIPVDGPRTIQATVTEVKLSFAVESEWGSPWPTNGTYAFSWGEAVAAGVEEPEGTNGVRYVCTGWTGTGSVPTSGTGTNLTFTIEEDSTIAWNWRKENRISVSVTGDGACAFGTQWVVDGTNATATIVPSTHLYAISLAGDTNGVTLAGTELTIPGDIPRDISVAVSEVKLSLGVGSARGTATPAGTTEWSWGDDVAAHVIEPEATNGVRYVCTGWTGTGSVPASGTGTNVAFTIEEDSTIAWNWRKENRIQVVVFGEGSCSFGTQWIADGDVALAEIVPTIPFFNLSIGGDAEGVTLSGTTLAIPSDRPRAIGVTVKGAADVEPSSVFRFYSKVYKGHFFTISEGEKDVLVDTNPNWKYECVAYRAFTEQVPRTVALYRFYSKNYRGHFFTIDEEEMRTVRDTNPNWKYENVAYYVYPEEVEGSVPVYRFWSKKYRHHFYTIDEEEMRTVRDTNPNWKYERVAFWALPNDESGPSIAQNDDCGTTNDECDSVVAEDTRGSILPSLWATLLSEGRGAVPVAAAGVTDVDGVLVEARGDAPDADDLGSPAGGDGKRSAPEGAVPHSAFGIRHFLLFLPSGRWNVSLWSARDGIVADESAEGSFSFAPPDSGVWHWLRVRDAADEDADDAFSLWIRTDWRQ